MPVLVTALVLTAACSAGTVEETGCAELPIADLAEVSQRGPAVVLVVHPSLPQRDLEAGIRSVAEAIIPFEPDTDAAPRLSVMVAAETANEVRGTCIEGAALAPRGAGAEVRRHSLRKLRSGLADAAVREVRRASPGDDGRVRGEDPVASLVGGAAELRRLAADGDGTLLVIAPAIPTVGRCTLVGPDSDPDDGTPVGVEIAASGGTFERCDSTVPDLQGVRVLWLGVGRGHEISTSAGQVLQRDLRDLLDGAGAERVTVASDPRVPAHAFGAGPEEQS